MLESWTFTLYKDNKPLTYAFTQKSDKCSQKQLDFTSQFTSGIRHVKGVENISTDTFTQTDTLTCPTPINYKQIAEAESSDSHLQACVANVSSLLKLWKFDMPDISVELYCDTSTTKIRPIVPLTKRNVVFEVLCNISHPGLKTNVKLISDRFVRPSIKGDCD